MMKYKNYYGKVDYDDEAKIFHGELVGIRAVITFQGTTIEELQEAFKDSIDDYLEWCKKRDKQPESMEGISEDNIKEGYKATRLDKIEKDIKEIHTPIRNIVCRLSQIERDIKMIHGLNGEIDAFLKEQREN